MFASKDALFTAPSGYTIARSVRLRSSASAYFNRTPASAGNRKIWTYSGWIKRGKIGADQTIFGAGYSTSPWFILQFDSNDVLDVSFTAGVSNGTLTNAVYRDPSAWYHIVCAVDTTQATASNRMKLYVNGVQVTSFSSTSYPSQNTDYQVNNTVQHYISNGAWYFDGYMADVYLIDGQALTPSSFGSTNAITGVWQPSAYTGTYGTNGFYLNFSDNSSNTSTTIGKDYSGNGNNWTPNNISVTSGVTYDSMTDVPTLTSATAANYCVLNPLNKQSSSTVSDGNLALATASTGYGTTVGSMGVSSGKWYWEQTYVAGGDCFAGVVKDGFNINTATYLGNDAYSYSYYNNPARAYNNGSYVSYGATYTTGDIIGVALDMDAGTLVFYKNGVSQGTAFTGLSGTFFPAASDGNNAGTGSYVFNFGQRPFTYTPPTGFVALNTQNLPATTINNGATVMAATTYTGTGATQVVSNAVNSISMQPDLVWLKSRSNARDHRLMDSVRGINNVLNSNLASVEYSGSALSSINSNGFTLNTTDNQNVSSETYIGWQWKAGGTSVSNTSGILTSQVSANTTDGFSVCTYTAPSSSQANSFGHGLGVAPSMVIAKNRSSGTGGLGWAVYHSSLGANQVLSLNTTAASATVSGYWGSGMTSTVVGLPTCASSTGFDNCTGNMVAYCFAPVAGFSAFGSYTGNGSADGPFNYLGFRPRWILIKRTDATANWRVLDTSRDTFNVESLELYPSLANAEGTFVALDGLSNGFKIRNNDTTYNASGGTYIYAAFAENPFKYSLAR